MFASVIIGVSAVVIYSCYFFGIFFVFFVILLVVCLAVVGVNCYCFSYCCFVVWLSDHSNCCCVVSIVVVVWLIVLLLWFFKWLCLLLSFL